METIETLFTGLGIIALGGIALGILLSAALYVWGLFHPIDADAEEEREAAKYDHWNL